MAAENKILERAEMYLRKLSCGTNPLTDEALAESDVCKQERISKCLAFVADFLQQKNMPKPVLPKKSRQSNLPQKREIVLKKLEITPDIVSKYEVEEVAISLSAIVRKINTLLPADMIRLVYADIAEILSQQGILEKEADAKGKELNLPTPRGVELGFARAEANIRGHFSVFTKCSAQAQKYILDNIQLCASQANARLENANAAKQKFHLTEIQLQNYAIVETPIPITEVARRLNDLLAPNANIEKLYFGKIQAWFVAQNYLEEKKNALGATTLIPTELGLSAGIVTESRMGKNGESYEAVLYNASAQKLILSHLDEIA